MLTPDETNTILNSYKWIKVPKLHLDTTEEREQSIHKLQTHHIDECTFLQNFIIERLHSAPLHILSQLPDPERFDETSYRKLDETHIQITMALINEIRQRVRQLNTQNN